VKSSSATVPSGNAEKTRGSSAPGLAERLAFAAGVLALAAAYFGAARLGLALAFQAEQVTAVWPPTGIALAAVLLFGYGVWPGIALGAFFANLMTANETLLTACGIAVGNTFEALAGAWLLCKLVHFRSPLERLRDVLGLVILAGAGCTMVSATIGVTTLCLAGVHDWAAYGALWWLWWLGDAAGTVLVAPLLLTWAYALPLPGGGEGRVRGPETSPRPRRPAEAAALIGTLILVSLVVFAGGVTPGTSRHPLEYTIFPFVVWAALRFGQPGTTAVTFGAAGIALWGTVNGLGPFATGTTHENLIVLQAFMVVVAVTALLLSAAITERKRTAEALRRSEEESRRQLGELEALYRTAPVGLSLVDTSLRYIRVNQALAEINGVPTGKTLGRTLHEVIPEIAPLIEPAYRQVIESGEPVLGFEIHGSTPREPGVDRDWLVSYHPLHAPDGSVAGVNCIVEDVTDRKRAEEALRQSEQRLAAELEAMTRLHALSTRLLSADNLSTALDDVLENAIATSGADFGNIQLYNPQIGALEIIAQRGFQPDFLDYFRTVRVDEGSACAQAMQSGKRMIIEDVQRDPLYERHRPIAAAAGYRAVQSTPLKNAAGTIVGMLSTHFRQPQRVSERNQRLLDLYARHAADFLERIRFEQALKEADRRKDEFLATLAHELRNPLAPIRNALHILQLAADDREIQAQVRAVMERQLGQMVRLIDDLLDVSRVTRNKLELRKEQIELATAIQSAVEATQPLMENLAHELTVTLPREPVYLDADPVRLSQIFSNLLNNAAKFTDRAGQVWLTALKQGGEVLVSVRDTGIGIASEHLPRLFDMFSQASPALDRSQGGLGIGLSLVRRLVELHGGSIEAHSQGPGLGSEFIVRLPVIASIVPAPEKPNGEVAPARSGRSYRILVVDDSRDAAYGLGKMLQMLGHDIRTAYDGLEAVQAEAAFRPDVVLLDIGLPKMNGYEAARQIRKQPWGKNLLLVAVTGWGQEEDKQRAREAGFDHHLTKPVEPEAVLNLLATASNRSCGG
jgi:PAS domain S-box-containing protein